MHFHGFLQEEKTLQKGFWTRGATRHIHVDRKKFVDALNYTIDVVHAAGIGT